MMIECVLKNGQIVESIENTTPQNTQFSAIKKPEDKENK